MLSFLLTACAYFTFLKMNAALFARPMVSVDDEIFIYTAYHFTWLSNLINLVIIIRCCHFFTITLQSKLDLQISC